MNARLIAEGAPSDDASDTRRSLPRRVSFLGGTGDSVDASSHDEDNADTDDLDYDEPMALNRRRTSMPSLKTWSVHTGNAGEDGFRR